MMKKAVSTAGFAIWPKNLFVAAFLTNIPTRRSRTPLKYPASSTMPVPSSCDTPLQGF
jgi:hypothetical protein